MSELGLKTIVLYGNSGLGKSTEAVRFAKHMYQQYRKPIYLVSAESSSRAHFAPLIEAGIVRALWLSAGAVMQSLRRLRRGMWPLPTNGGSLTWQALDWVSDKAPCAAIYEGLSSISELAMEQQRREGVLPVSGKDGKGEFAFEDEKFQCASQRNYGMTQDELLWTLAEVDKLPLKRVLWTSHEYVGEEQDTHRTVLGPQLVGKAKTPSIGRYCGMLLHMEGYPVRIEVQVGGESLPRERIVRRVWFCQHPDPLSGILYPAKLTVPLGGLKKLYEAHPNGYFEPSAKKDGPGLDAFLKLEEELRMAEADDLKLWKTSVDQAAKA